MEARPCAGLLRFKVERDRLEHGPSSVATDAVKEGLHALARWLYRQLEREYAYLSSDAVVDEAITANG